MVRLQHWKQTYQQLAEQFNCSVRIIQRHVLKAPKAQLSPPKFLHLNLLVDTTFFGRQFGILVMMDSRSENIVYHQVVHSEKDVYYQKAMNRIREKGYKIQSITCDGRRGILNDYLNTPTQMCHFHMVAIVIRKLTRKPKSAAGKALKTLVKTLKNSTQNAFYKALHLWYLEHKEFLEERSEKPNEKGKYPYKHRMVRSAHASLKRYEKYLFTFENYPDLHIEKTTNRLEGLFKDLKQKLSIHNGLTSKHKIMFIQDFLNKKSG